MIRKAVLLILIATVGVACQAPQAERTCDEVSARVLRDIIEAPRSPEEVRKQIADGYGLPLEQVLTSSDAGETYYQWSKDHVDGSMSIGRSNPVHGGLYYTARPPSVALVTACLGTPDFYSVYYQRGGPEAAWNSLELTLFFARRGVVAAAYVPANGKEPPKLAPTILMKDFGFTLVGSVEDTMKELNENQSTEFRQRIKPWPGKLEDVVVDIGSNVSQ